MDDSVQQKFERIRKVMRLERPDRLPWGDLVIGLTYRSEVYGAPAAEYQVAPGVVGQSRDGKARYTHDGGVWALGDKEKYRDFTDVLSTDPNSFEVEQVGPAMLDEMAALYAEAARTCFPGPMIGTTVYTRATYEFDWVPFLMASALEPRRFGKILDRFGEASLAIAKGWAETEGTELIIVHDDIAATRGPISSPRWLREYVFPWYRVIFDAIHERGRKVQHITDGNYLPVLDDLLDAGADGLYVESASVDPAEVTRRAGKDKLFLIKSNSRTVDFGTPEEIRVELEKLRELHEDYPGMILQASSGWSRLNPANVEAFKRYHQELLVYS